MDVDVFGSRNTLIPLLSKGKDNKVFVKNCYIGSNLESQYSQATKFNIEKIKSDFSKYDYLEQLNDYQKSFRRYSDRSNTNVLIVDFYMETKPSIFINNNKLTQSLLLKYSYGGKIESEKVIPYVSRLNNINNLMKKFNKQIEHYDLIILNQVKLPTPSLIVQSSEEIINYHLQNTLITICENLLIKSRKNIAIIPFYKNDSAHTEKYIFDKEYQNYLIEEINSILSKNRMK